MASEMKSVCVSHGGVRVRFSSRDDSEIDTIGDCYKYFWAVEQFESDADVWSVVSHDVESVGDLIDLGELQSPVGLYKDGSAGKAVLGDRHCYVHRVQDVLCLTSFNQSRRTIDFYHEGEIDDHSYIRNLVREPMLARYKQEGYVTIHASACSIGGRGLLMPGLKGAGKSTLMSHLLGAGAQFIGNDGVLCRRVGGAILLTAIPQCVRLSKPTIQNNQDLARYFSGDRPCKFIENKVEFLPSLFDEILPSHQLSSSSRLDLVLVPSLDTSRTDYSIEVCDRSAVLPLMRESLFYPYHHYVWSPFFDALNDPQIDEANFSEAFGGAFEVRRLRYGVLDDRTQKKMFRDIADTLRSLADADQPTLGDR